MRSVPPFVSHCLELLAPLGAVRARRMFGGYGLYLDELFVALIADERLYLKVDDVARPAFERADCQPFAYSRRDRSAVTLGYWTAPDEALDSPQAMEPWVRRSLAAALRGKSGPRTPVATSAQSGDRRRQTAASASAPRAAKVRG